MTAAITAAVIGVAGAAYSANQSAKQAKKQAAAASQPTKNDPWSGALPILNGAVTDLQAANQARKDAGPLAYIPPPSRGGGGGNYSGASQQQRDLADAAAARALGNNDLLNAGSTGLQGLAAGGTHPLLGRAFNNAERTSNGSRNMQRLIDQSFAAPSAGEGLQADDYYRRFLDSMMEPSRGGGRGRGGGGGGGGSGLGGGGGGRGGGGGMVSDASVPADIFAGMTTSSSGKRGVGGAVMGTKSGNQRFAEPQAGPTTGLGPDIERALRSFLSGDYLRADNPYFAEVENAMRSQSARTLAEQRGAVDAQLGGSQYGGGSWAAAQAGAASSEADALNSRLAKAKYDNYAMGLSQMLQAAGQGDQRQQWQAADATQREGIRSSAAVGMAGVDAQRDAARWNATLGGLQGMGQFELGVVGADQNRMGQLGGWITSQMGDDTNRAGLMGQLGSTAAQGQLSAIGQIPGMDQAFYNAFGSAGQLAGQVTASNQQAEAMRQADADAAWQSEMQNWQAYNDWRNYSHDYDWNTAMDYANAGVMLGGVGSSTQGPKVVAPSVTGATIAGAMSGLSGALSSYAASKR